MFYIIILYTSVYISTKCSIKLRVFAILVKKYFMYVKLQNYINYDVNILKSYISVKSPLSYKHNLLDILAHVILL